MKKFWVPNEKYWEITDISEVQKNVSQGLKWYENWLFDESQKLSNSSEIRLIYILGIGAGRELIDIAQRYPDSMIVGFDISEKLLETCRTRIIENKLEKRVSLHKIDIVELINFERADIVFLSNSVLTFIIPESNRRKVIQNVINLCKSNGLIVGEVHNRNDRFVNRLFFIYQGIRNFFSTKKIEYGDRLVSSGGYTTLAHFFSESEVRKLLKDTDIKVIKKVNQIYPGQRRSKYNTILFICKNKW